MELYELGQSARDHVAARRWEGRLDRVRVEERRRENQVTMAMRRRERMFSDGHNEDRCQCEICQQSKASEGECKICEASSSMGGD